MMWIGRTWRLMNDGRELLAMPRLRLLDLPVPSVYGPTADENPFAN